MIRPIPAPSFPNARVRPPTKAAAPASISKKLLQFTPFSNASETASQIRTSPPAAIAIPPSFCRMVPRMPGSPVESFHASKPAPIRSTAFAIRSNRSSSSSNTEKSGSMEIPPPLEAVSPES